MPDTPSPTPPLDGPRLAPPEGGPAANLAILLHGLGADGQDMAPLARGLAPWLPRTAFFCPDAPFACDMAPVGRQWFSLRALSSSGAEWSALARGIQEAAPTLQAAIDAELARSGLGTEQLVLAGFSQGAMMALHAGLRRDPPVAGIVSFSGMVIDTDGLAAGEGWPPVLMSHGEADEVIAPEALAAGEQTLAALGVRVEAHLRPGVGHGIDPESLALGGRFLARCLDRATGA